MLIDVYYCLNACGVIDSNMFDNIMRNEVYNITNITDDVLVTELYWRVALLINKHEWMIHRVVHNNVFMNTIVKCIKYEHKWNVLEACFKCVKAIIKYANESDIKYLLIEMNIFNTIVSNIFDKITELKLAYYIFATIYYSLKRWDTLHQSHSSLLLHQFIMHGGVDVINKYTQTDYWKLMNVLHKLVREFNLMNTNDMDVDEVCTEYNVIKI
jgi:hypothetical protein